MTGDRQKMNREPAVPRKAALELCFISFVGIVVISAFVRALSYDFISARAPLVIMVPLLILIAAQFRHTRAVTQRDILHSELSQAARGQNRTLNIAIGFIAWMALLLVLIFVIGHYAGMAAFMFVLLRMVSKETTLLSVSVTAAVTGVVYLLFEHVFNIELYRGLLLRLLSG